MDEDMMSDDVIKQELFAGIADEFEEVARGLRSDQDDEAKGDLVRAHTLKLVLSDFCKGYPPPTDYLERSDDVQQRINQLLQDFRE